MNQKYDSINKSHIDIGSRLEMFVDRHIVERLDGVSLRLHTPQRMPEPLSPLTGGYMTVIKENDRYRAYYRKSKPLFNPEKAPPPADAWGGTWADITCYAESQDGIEWTEPVLNLVKDELFGSFPNAILDTYPFAHNLAPFRDKRPGVPEQERFKALAGGTRDSGLHAFASEDGIRWRKLHDSPVLSYDPEPHGTYAFDSQNISFWSEAEGCYVCYFRHNRTPHGTLRTISRMVSPDFLNWTDQSADFEAPNLPGEQLYTSQTHPYFRAPHIYVALPTRIVLEHGGETDILFMTSRAGARRYDRLFREAFIRPGLEPARWENRANYVALNVVPTGSAEMSIYHNNGDRYVLRTDGFASVHASAEGGEFVTRPLIFSGSNLVLNLSTSIRGGIRVELQDAGGMPFSGYALDDCDPILGDSIEYVATWRGQSDLSRFAGRPVRLRFALQDSDLYSLQFHKGEDKPCAIVSN